MFEHLATEVSPLPNFYLLYTFVRMAYHLLKLSLNYYVLPAALGPDV
jgi:hypothetical protein